MATLNGKKYSKNDILSYCGSVDQIASIKSSVLNSGKANGLQCFSVNTGGGLSFDVLPNKCLDIASVSFNGINVAFISKNGYVGPDLNMPTGDDFVNYMSGGLLFTCGLRNVGKSCVDNTDFHPLHGRIGLTPAQNPFSKCYWEGDEYILEIGGVMRETALFGVNMSLTRRIITRLGSSEIEVLDTIENLNPTEQEFMFLYHVNFGFPFLDEKIEVDFPKCEITPRTDVAKQDIALADVYTKPVDNLVERVYFRDVKETENGLVTIDLINRELGISAKVKYEKENLPNLTQWKSMRSGDYALGIEPSNSGVDGVSVERERGTLKKIPGFSKLEYRLKLEFSKI